MDVFILTQHHEDYDIIKHINEDCLHMLYFDPQKYPVAKQFQGNENGLLCNDLVASAIKQGYQIVKNDFYLVGGLTVNMIEYESYGTKKSEKNNCVTY